MKITQEVRDYANKKGISDTQALKEGMQERSHEFIKLGSEIYHRQ